MPQDVFDIFEGRFGFLLWDWLLFVPFISHHKTFRPELQHLQLNLRKSIHLLHFLLMFYLFPFLQMLADFLLESGNLARFGLFWLLSTKPYVVCNLV